MKKSKNFIDKIKIHHILIVLAILLFLGGLITLLVYIIKKINKKPETSAPTEKIMEVNNDNKVILVNDKFIRYDSGLYTRPQSYQGVNHHGPVFINLDRYRHRN